MRILHVITGLNTGGAEMMLFKLLSGMDSSRFQSTVVSLIDKGTLGERIEAAGVPVHALGMQPGIPSPYFAGVLSRLILKENPDVIQGWMYHANILATVSSAILLKKYPVVWNIRQSLYSLDYEKKRTAFVIKGGAYLSRFPRQIIYNSITGAAQHEHVGYRAEKRVIIPNGFITDIFRPSRDSYTSLRAELGLSANTFIIGLVGRFHPMKDHLTFLQAASRLIQKHHSVHFVLVGKEVDCNNSVLLKQISELMIDEHVHLLGERSDTPHITAAFDVATSSSFTEGFPNVVGEAMSCGVPCVVTDVGDSAWIVSDTGNVVPPRNPEALAGAWCELIEMGTERRNGLGMSARQRIIDSFSMDVVVKHYEELYADVVAGR